MRMLKPAREDEQRVLIRELRRKSIHILLGVLIAYLVLVLSRDLLIILSSISLISALLFSLLAKRGIRVPLIYTILEACERESAMATIPGRGAILFLSGILILLLLIRDSLLIASAILVLALGDGFATLAGFKWGRHRFLGKKSLEGSLAFLFASFIGLLILLEPVYALIGALTGMLIEAVSNDVVDDNLTIPLGVSIVLMMLRGGH